MRAIYIDADRQVGAARRRHKFTFGAERKIPSGVEFYVWLDAARIGVARGIDTLSPRGKPLRIWEVQLDKTLYRTDGNNLTLALTRILPHAKKLTGIA